LILFIELLLTAAGATKLFQSSDRAPVQELHGLESNRRSKDNNKFITVSFEKATDGDFFESVGGYD
jgi:hypothetical protein